MTFRVLVQTGMLAKEREPGTRVDQYRVYDEDVWAAINRQRMPSLERWAQVIEDGVDLVGRHTRGGRRLLQSQALLPVHGRATPSTGRGVAPAQGRTDRGTRRRVSVPL